MKLYKWVMSANLRKHVSRLNPLRRKSPPAPLTKGSLYEVVILNIKMKETIINLIFYHLLIKRQIYIG